MLRFIALLLMASSAVAQPIRLEWKAGETHTYDVSQTTTTTEVLTGKTLVSSSKLTLTKAWSVKAVQGPNATLELVITEMRNEITRPVNGQSETSVIDSRTPEGRESMKDYLQKVLLTATIDNRGRVVEVKSDLPGATSRLRAELPFRIELPENAPAKDVQWHRPFEIKLDPPAGAGEVYEALQSVTLDSQKDARTTFKLTTSLKKSPADVAEWQPLWPWLWEGTVTMDQGRYVEARLKIQREYPNHAGVGSRLSFVSEWNETRR